MLTTKGELECFAVVHPSRPEVSTRRKDVRPVEKLKASTAAAAAAAAVETGKEGGDGDYKKEEENGSKKNVSNESKYFIEEQGLQLEEMFFSPIFSGSLGAGTRRESLPTFGV